MRMLLTGGSAFGLDAASGVMRWLEERGFGLQVGPVRVPIVPAAVLFDLLVGDARIRPDAAAGYAACQAASRDAPAQGNVGAGAGATVGKLFGFERGMKGGIGTASMKVGAITVGALVAVNATGDIVDPADGRIVAGTRGADGRPRSATEAIAARRAAGARAARHGHDHRHRRHRRRAQQGAGQQAGDHGARRPGTHASTRCTPWPTATRCSRWPPARRASRAR